MSAFGGKTDMRSEALTDRPCPSSFRMT